MSTQPTLGPAAAEAARLLREFRRERHGWEGWARLRCWGGAELPIHIERDDDELDDLAPRQIAVLRVLLAHPDDLRPTFERALFAYYKDEIEPLSDADTPPVVSPVEMWARIEGPAVWIDSRFRTPAAAEFKVTFNCEWDIEHGLGVRFVDWIPVTFGGFDAW